MNMQTTKVSATLYKYVTNETTWFYWYHDPLRLKKLHKKFGDENPWKFDCAEIENDLYGFFYAVLDEVRLKKVRWV